jgi:antitoxin VapB
MTLTGQHRLKLFRSRGSQALRVPREFELPGNEATIRKEGHRLVIEPVMAERSSLVAYLATMKPHDFPDIEDSPPESVDL